VTGIYAIIRKTSKGTGLKMDEKNYKITLGDGTEIDNLRLNGNNYISTESVGADIFDGNCSPVMISDGTNDEIHDNMELVQINESNGEYWFVLRDVSSEELSKIKIRSDIEYVAMMAGVEL
jgi:hypothetical protein